jgi:RHH-type rel operon transcriptional repressor/antitoxin RelB
VGTQQRPPLIIRLPQSIEKRLGKLAQGSGRITTELAREAIVRYVEDSEDTFEAERILWRVRNGLEKTYTLKQVAQRIGMED